MLTPLIPANHLWRSSIERLVDFGNAGSGAVGWIGKTWNEVAG